MNTKNTQTKAQSTKSPKKARVRGLRTLWRLHQYDEQGNLESMQVLRQDRKGLVLVEAIPGKEVSLTPMAFDPLGMNGMAFGEPQVSGDGAAAAACIASFTK